VSRVVLVTGAGRGIGAATARALLERGWTVVGLDRGTPDPRLPYPMASRADLHALADDGVDVVEADVADRRAVDRAVADLVARHGGLDAVVAAAGVIAGGVPLWEMPGEQLDAVLEVTLRGVITTARSTVPALLARPTPRQGRFIAVSSCAARRGLGLLAAYCAAKAGVSGLVRGMAADLRGTGITANAVSPGSTETTMLEESARLHGLARAEDFAAQQLTERLIDPAEVAAAIVWLASEPGGAVTGADIAVDAGLSV
jgi:SDR family mycofactocin-dependent oxidoreductase